MFVRKLCAALGATTVVASGFALAGNAPAHADPAGGAASVSAKDIVGVGSDTTQIVVGDLANQYNSTVPGTAADKAGGAKLASWDACTIPAGQYYPCNVDTSADLLLRSTSTTKIVRPNGSGAGMTTLETNTDNPEVSFARSSSALNDAAASSNLVAFPFAVDGLEMAVAPNTHAPASLSAQQIAQIYAGQITNWSEVGGQAGAIHAYYPQAGSGTGKFFIAQLEAISHSSDATAVVAGAHDHEWNPTAGDYSGPAVEEHDPTAIKDDPDALAPFSVGRAKLIIGSSGPIIKQEPGWTAKRAVYNIVRSKDNSGSGKDNPAWFSGSPVMKSLFGPGGFFCSPAAEKTIEANGFEQLKRPADGGACGVAVTTSGGTPSTLAAYNTGTGKLAPRVAGTAAASRYGVGHLVRVRALGTTDLNPTGSVKVTVAGRSYSARLDPTGGAAVTLPATLAAGTYRGIVSYPGDLNFKAATGVVSVTVTKIGTTMSAVFPKTVKRGRKVAGTVTLRAAVGKATGTVVVMLKSKRLASVRLVGGVAHVSFLRKALKLGRNVLTVKYLATGNYTAPAPKRVTITRKK